MTQSTEVKTNGEKSGQPEEKATDRDLQRQAARGLVILSEKCAADEVDTLRSGMKPMRLRPIEIMSWRSSPRTMRGKAAEEAVRAKYEREAGEN